MAAALATATPAFAHDSQDRVSFAQRIVVRPDEKAGDLVCFLCSIENHGNVHGDVVSFLGGVKSEGAIDGDVVSFFGDVNLAGDASVHGNLVILGGNLRKGASVQTGSSQVIFPTAIVLFPFLIVAAILWGVTRVFRRRPMYFPRTGR